MPTPPPQRDIGPRPTTVLFVLLVLLAAGALAVSAYLASVALTAGARPLGCSGEGGCSEVLSSPWSRWGPLPVAMLGVLLYGSVLVALLMLPRCRRLADRRRTWRVLVGLAGVTLAGAAWLTVLQVAIIGSFCLWCMIDHAMAVALAVLLLAVAPWGRRHAENLGHGEVFVVTAAALGAVSVVFAGQHLARVEEEGRTTWTESSGDSVVATVVDPFAVPMPVAEAPGGRLGADVPAEAPSSVAAPRRRPAGPLRKIVLGDGRIKVTLPLPMLGNSEAEHVIIELFDYACPHCRHMHHRLDAVRKHFGAALAILALPVPLNPDCNPNVKDSKPGFSDACKLAELALAVWLSDPDAFEPMHQWLLVSEKVPGVSDARRHAENLVGADALAEALEDPWVTRQIRADVLLHERTSGIENRNATLPKLIHRLGIATGLPQTAAALARELERTLGIEPAGPPLNDAVH